MPVVTAIKPQKQKKRVNVFVDHKFCFGLDLETYVTSKIKVGDKLSQKKIDKISEKGKERDVFSKLLNYATIRPRSKKELEKWLSKKKIPEKRWPKLIAKLEKLDLAGDYKFCQWWIDQRTSFRPRGKKMLFFELLKKGVDKKTIESALKDTDIDEMAMAIDLLEKKAYKWKKEKGFEKRKKMSGYLARRGFSWSVIKKALKEIKT